MMNFSALKNLKKDQKIVVGTADKKFLAKFNKLSLNGYRLDVVDVRTEDGKPFGAFKYFSIREVTSVSIFDDEIPETPEVSPLPSSQLTQPQLAIISDAIANFTYIQRPDAKYFAALDDIAKRFVIGISTDCCRGRIDNSTLLAISTGDKVYIFDLLSLNTEKTIGELKAVLDSDSHLKIVYDSSNIVDNFKFKLRVELQPAFDVLLAAAQFYETGSLIGLGNIVKTVLGVDIDLVEFKGSVVRPVNQEFLHSFAVKTAYLVAMYHKLAAKGFSYAFSKHVIESDISAKDFFDGLCLSDSQKLEKQLQSGKIKEVDFSIYEKQ